jgi:hypothetical protein
MQTNICKTEEIMKKFIKFSIKVSFTILLIGGIIFMIGGCTNRAAEPSFVLAEALAKKEIYSDSLYAAGILAHTGETACIEAQDPEQAARRSIVFPVEYGKSYELHFNFSNAMKQLAILSTETDPRALAIGEKVEATLLRSTSGKPTEADLGGFLYTPRKEKEFLVVFMGATVSIPISITEHTIIAAEDTKGSWYKPEKVGDFLGNADSFADYRWTSDEVYENLYEPLRKQYPDYIKREHIGKDESGTYDMYCYIFEPENYEQSVFLSGGMHANEEEGYLALAYFMGEVANAKRADSELFFLKQKVRFIVIPLINVWGINQTHVMEKANWSIRYNSTETDLNRDFQDQTQQETKSVRAVLEKYGDSISFGIDFHTTPNDNGSDLFFNFNISADNVSANFQTTNHIYHRMVEEGMITENRPLLIPSDSAYGALAAINGKYASSRTLQACLWNEYGIPPITVEYMNFTSGKSPKKGSAEGLSMAAEIFGNFIIQNAHFFLGKAQ